MSATTRSSGPSSVQWLIESRPPSVTWSRQAPREANQPTLDLVEHDEDNAAIAASNDRGIRVQTVKARWAARPRPGLPNAQDWSTMLALAIIQVLLGKRPAAHSNRSKYALGDLVTFAAVILVFDIPYMVSHVYASQLGRSEPGTTSKETGVEPWLMMPPHRCSTGLARN
jgi:hypothetical protein